MKTFPAGAFVLLLTIGCTWALGDEPAAVRIE